MIYIYAFILIKSLYLELYDKELKDNLFKTIELACMAIGSLLAFSGFGTDILVSSIVIRLLDNYVYLIGSKRSR